MASGNKSISYLQWPQLSFMLQLFSCKSQNVLLFNLMEAFIKMLGPNITSKHFANGPFSRKNNILGINKPSHSALLHSSWKSPFNSSSLKHCLTQTENKAAIQELDHLKVLQISWESFHTIHSFKSQTVPASLPSQYWQEAVW